MLLLSTANFTRFDINFYYDFLSHGACQRLVSPAAVISKTPLLTNTKFMQIAPAYPRRSRSIPVGEGGQVQTVLARFCYARLYML